PLPRRSIAASAREPHRHPRRRRSGDRCDDAGGCRGDSHEEAGANRRRGTGRRAGDVPAAPRAGRRGRVRRDARGLPRRRGVVRAVRSDDRRRSAGHTRRGTIARLNIGLFAPYDLARAGGVGSHMRAQARALRALGHHVRIFGPASAPPPKDEVAVGRSLSITLGGTASGMGVDPRAVRQLSRLFAPEPFDIVPVHEPLMPAVPWLAVWLARAPVVATFHVHREDGHHLYRLARSVLRPLMGRITARIAVSEAARRTVAGDFPGDYTIIPNGIEPTRFQATTAGPARLPRASRLVLYVGRLEPRKGVDVLVEAMALVRRQIPDAALVVVGDGPGRPSLERLARK